MKVPVKYLKLPQVSGFVFDEVPPVVLDLQNMIRRLTKSKRSLVGARDLRCWPSLYEMLEELMQRLDTQIQLNRSLSPFRHSGQCKVDISQ